MSVSNNEVISTHFEILFWYTSCIVFWACWSSEWLQQPRCQEASVELPSATCLLAAKMFIFLDERAYFFNISGVLGKMMKWRDYTCSLSTFSKKWELKSWRVFQKFSKTNDRITSDACGSYMLFAAFCSCLKALLYLQTLLYSFFQINMLFDNCNQNVTSIPKPTLVTG